MEAKLEAILEGKLDVTQEAKKEAIQVANKEVIMEAILEAKKYVIMEAIVEETKDTVMEAKLDATSDRILEAKLEATIDTIIEAQLGVNQEAKKRSYFQHTTISHIGSMIGRKTRSIEGNNNGSNTFGAKVGAILSAIFGAQVSMHCGIGFCAGN